MQKNGSAGSVISVKKSVTDSEVSNIMLKQNNLSILEPLERVNESVMLEKNKSQESVLNDRNSDGADEYRAKYTPEMLKKDRESRLSSENNEKENLYKHHKNMKSENLVKKKALQPSEFKMKSDVDEKISPSRRMIENKNKNRLKSNQSKVLLRNDSQSQLSSNKKLNRNESQRTLSKEKVLDSPDRNEHSMSKKLIKNLREHIALKLYENNVPTSGYHRVVGKSRYVFYVA